MNRLALLACALAACTPPDGGVGDSLVDGIAAHAPGDTVDLAALAPFAWDRVHVVEPYTTAGVFERRSGVGWPTHWEWGAIEMRDDRALLVFAEGGRAVAAVEVPRAAGDLVPSGAGPPDAEGIARDDARFAVRAGDDGRRTLVR